VSPLEWRSKPPNIFSQSSEQRCIWQVDPLTWSPGLSFRQTHLPFNTWTHNPTPPSWWWRSDCRWTSQKINTITTAFWGYFIVSLLVFRKSLHRLPNHRGASHWTQILICQTALLLTVLLVPHTEHLLHLSHAAGQNTIEALWLWEFN
jgi:hypothetical protein